MDEICFILKKIKTNYRKIPIHLAVFCVPAQQCSVPDPLYLPQLQQSQCLVYGEMVSFWRVSARYWVIRMGSFCGNWEIEGRLAWLVVMGT